MSRQVFARRLVSAVFILSAGVFSAGPAAAQGFFDQLFGTQSAPAPSVSAPVPDSLFPSDPSGPAPRQFHKHALVDEKPVLQKPTDLMHDKTLQVGDAVMMKDGIHVYNGPEAAKHNRRQFVALDDASSVSPSSRVKLADLDPTHSESMQEGRSTTEIVQGFKITDARGNSIRYVGP